MGDQNPEIVIKKADISDDMQTYAINMATYAYNNYSVEKDVASYMKLAFEDKYEGVWNCIVGKNFGCHVSHEAHHYLYFYMNEVSILLFKSTDVRIDG